MPPKAQPGKKSHINFQGSENGSLRITVHSVVGSPRRKRIIPETAAHGRGACNRSVVRLRPRAVIDSTRHSGGAWRRPPHCGSPRCPPSLWPSCAAGSLSTPANSNGVRGRTRRGAGRHASPLGRAADEVMEDPLHGWRVDSVSAKSSPSRYPGAAPTSRTVGSPGAPGGEGRAALLRYLSPRR
jgi:hypothetical protein